MKFIKEGFNLFENQKYNVERLSHRRRALLCDKCGNGKTASVLYAYALLKEQNKLNNIIVFTPLSAYKKKVWKTDIQKFTNFRAIDLESLYERVQNYPQNISKYLENYDVIYAKHSHVVKSDYLELVEKICGSPRVLAVIDEGHVFKNPRAKATIQMRMGIRNAYALWVLTATPLSKNLEDTYNIINFTYPGFLGSFMSFKNNYCRVSKKVIGRSANGGLRKIDVIEGVKDEEEFSKRIEPLVIKGESTFRPKFHYLDYQLSEHESQLYRKVAAGLDMNEECSVEEWIERLMHTNMDEQETHPIKDVNRYSSRFIYLQSAADGILTDGGLQNNYKSSKIDTLLSTIEKIVEKGESCLVYFDYYASLEAVEKAIHEKRVPAVVLTSTGKSILDENQINEAKCKAKPHVVLCTKASSESASYYFMNHVIFFQIPTTVSTITQMAGRILRKNSLYPDDLNIYYLRSVNIDLYKLMLVSIKSYQMEITTGEENSIPPTYKELATKSSIIEKQKKYLLWNLR